MKNFTNPGTLRTYSVAVTIFMIGGVSLLYIGAIIDQSAKMPANRVIPKKSARSASNPALSPESRITSASNVANKSIHILLSAYHRSGSSYTGNLLASQPNTFYFFEPLIKLGEWGHFTPDDQFCDDLTGICRILNSSSDELKPLQNHMERYNISRADSFVEILHHLLHNIYDCHLEDMEDLIVEGITNSFTDTLKQLWYKYSWCRTRKSKHDCLPVVIGACRQSRIRVIKLVRLGLDIAAPLLEKDGTLKLVHLFRDPRGTIASRLVKTRWYPLFIANDDYSRVMKNAEILCKRMLKDFEAGSELIGRFPNRVKLIRYEDLNGNDDDVTFKVKDELRKFLDLIANSYTQKSKSKSSNDWIRLLNWKVIEIVDSVCYPVYQKLGYIRLDYQTWLNNRSGLTIP